ncbi:hypothetical protein CD122_02770 [Staphylococcus rostri]|uniref:Uncharacterized protein n=1 Tax=Staphylococcus rostri TaxID=522262 RepID=A0A2K3YU00_9STAP|nr:hypothetical protein CD122_02770 [Staphylococcus rostri]
MGSLLGDVKNFITINLQYSLGVINKGDFMDRFLYWCKFGLIVILVTSTLQYLLPSPESLFGSFVFSLSVAILSVLILWFLAGKPLK